MAAAAPIVSTGSDVARAVLREVARLLDALAHDPMLDETVDLHSLPLSEPDREGLRQRLGRGEVEAVFNLAGPTRVTETAYAGVWWVRHADADADDRSVLEQIVVARVPALLLAHPDDIATASHRLAAELETPITEETLDD
ncbi:hydrogenase expression/formation C-terminal domain-containing protein [Ideonella sp. A 288]|uniref:hydrogenase expression/formation C-terminal domain-containing protein n=1 Tax=Ideonella sp. A 288 TaxID=1962181 RepID=UPI0011857E8C|nr:hydrogenase expression/formation C-terminal domain-containing protein [Ideonella sp. A 288]